jgi:hypothetical protein
MGVNSTGGEEVALADVDVTTLSQYEATTFRQELIHALWNPGIEFDVSGVYRGTDDEKAYRNKLKEVDAHLKTFPEKI